MPRFKSPPDDVISDRRRALHEDITAGGIPVAAAVKRMRTALGMTQASYAKVFKLTVRQVGELERGKGNPTLRLLNRISKPFGFQTGLVLIPRPINPLADLPDNGKRQDGPRGGWAG